MSAQWQSLVSQKLYLAAQLSRMADQIEGVAEREACLQGAAELALRGRRLMLVLIAHYYQQKQVAPVSLEELAAIAGGCPELEELKALSTTPGSWWQHLDQLDSSQGNPPQPRKAAPDETLIAVSATGGPDRSREALQRTLDAMKSYLAELGQRNAEW